MRPPRDDTRTAAAALAFGVAVPVSYAAQRLYGALSGVEQGVVVAQVHIPYYWRCDVALLHGVVAGALVGFGLDARAAGAVLGASRWLVAVAVGASAVAMLVVP